MSEAEVGRLHDEKVVAGPERSAFVTPVDWSDPARSRP
jgi:hypothetical protein